MGPGWKETSGSRNLQRTKNPVGGRRIMSVKRTTWLVEILERAKRNLAAEQHKAAGTRLDLALTIARELLKRAQTYQKRDAEKKK
jgi:hypothetical protein